MNFGDREVTVQDVLVAFQEGHGFEEVAAAPHLKGVTEFVYSIGDKVGFFTYLAERARERGLDKTDTYQKYRKKVIQDELYQRILITDILNKIRITDNEIHRFYDENRSSIFLKRETDLYEVRGIYVFADRGPLEQAEAKIQDAYRQLERGTSFETVAQQFSEAPADVRGTVNRIPPHAFDTEIVRQLSSLEKGEYTKPFRVGQKLFIFQLIDFIPPDYTPLEDARASILQTLTKERMDRLVFALSQEYRQKHGCLVNGDLLEKAVNADPSALILSVPGVYELTLSEFESLAEQYQKNTLEEKTEYLQFLANTAPFYAESLSRGLSEKNVAPAAAYWEHDKLAEDFLRSEIPEIDEELMQDFFAGNRDKSYFQTPRIFDLSRIFFRADVRESMSRYQILATFQQTEQKAKQAFQELQTGRPFEEVISLYAEDETVARSGGNRGKFILNQLDIDSHLIVSKMKAGEISKPEQIADKENDRFGYEIFYVHDVEPARPMVYREARQVIRIHASRELYKRSRNQWKEKFLEEYPLTVNASVLQKVADYLQQLTKRPDRRGEITHYEEPLES